MCDMFGTMTNRLVDKLDKVSLSLTHLLAPARSLSLALCIYLSFSAYLSHSLSISLFLCLYLFLCLSLSFSVYISLVLSGYLSLSLAISLFLGMSLFLGLSLSFSVYLSFFRALRACGFKNALYERRWRTRGGLSTLSRTGTRALSSSAGFGRAPVQIKRLKTAI